MSEEPGNKELELPGHNERIRGAKTFASIQSLPQETRKAVGRLAKRAYGNLAERYLRIKEPPIELPPHILEEYKNIYPLLEKIYGENAYYWHGSGRYQYRDGQVVDILSEVVNANGLKPHEDLWLTRGGTRTTISAATSRMYAKLYAQLHTFQGEEPLYQYGGRKLWSNHFIGNFSKSLAFDIVQDALLNGNLLKHIRRLQTGRQSGVKQVWLSKVSSDPAVNNHSLISMMAEAESDIPGNYPVLLGLSKDSFTPVQVPGFIDMYEKRSSEPIPLEGFTHIEVPYMHVPQTQGILAGKGVQLPVVPLEFGDLYSRQFPFSQLTKGGYLTTA